MIIEAYRGNGQHQGTPITEPLLSDDTLLTRGRAEMDANASPFNLVVLNVVFRPGVRLGQLIEATDPSSVKPYRAKVTGIQITVSEANIDTQLNVEQPR